MYYLCDSSVLEDFEGTSWRSEKEWKAHLKGIGKDYRFGKMVGLSGQLNTTFFFFVPKSVSKLAASAQALITLGSPSPHLAHLSNASSPRAGTHYSLTHLISNKAKYRL